ncbi:nucleoside recognition domain-containing protein [Caldanaerobius polysaccharolyticus]|uniref:nucleoside recognition domain-containing protein n=1 Tax=Caldanaerobius polysaccharolyticus TaxID=44256 RepID=UPI00047ACC01|nr:nucleoside recognition domain-containing protein [Caldanaerobius polysaccharolyticus]
MINTIWFLLIFLSLVIGSINGRIDQVVNAAVESSTKAVEMALGLIGVMSLWLGIMKIAEKEGLIQSLSHVIMPFIRRIFSDIPPNHPSIGAMVMNISANMLGLGNAATPFGIKAMKLLQELNPHKDTATDAMCTFLIVNTGCIQLLPTTIIAIRAAAGSKDPMEIVSGVIITSTLTLVCGIFIAKSFEKDR